MALPTTPPPMMAMSTCCMSVDLAGRMRVRQDLAQAGHDRSASRAVRFAASGGSMSKISPGNFFEDFRFGQVIRHATPRTRGDGDRALYAALYGARFAVQSSDEFARAIGYPSAPIDDLLVFHIVFGKTVPDISLNAVANLGYAEWPLSEAGLCRAIRSPRSRKSSG